MDFCTEGIEEVLQELKTGEQGLGSAEAASRLGLFGRNVVEYEKGRSALGIFLSQFRSVLVYLLFAAAAIAFALGERLDAAAIAGILVINAVLGFAQESRAEKALKALKKMVVPKAVVVRDGREREIDAGEVVAGDIVVVREGDKVPADLRIIEAFLLLADESMLTGESAAAEKSAEVLARGAPLAEQSNMLFANTLVARGKAKGVVVKTGAGTEFGKIAKMISEEQPRQMLLNVKMEQFSRKLGLFIVGLAAALFLLGIAKGAGLLGTFMLAVSLAVAAIPEGLPIVVTITLALGAQAMAKKKAIVRRMAVIEALGSATVICSDKTGTFTLNEMTVKKIIADGKEFEVSGLGYGTKGEITCNGAAAENKVLEKLIVAGASCNDAAVEFDGKGKAGSRIGDPTEVSLRVLCKKAGLAPLENRLSMIPFTSERKMMSTLHKIDEKMAVFLKGAPERVVEACDCELLSSGAKKLTAERKDELLRKADELAGKAYRVLAIACKDVGKAEITESGMAMLGLVAILDPPRKEVRDAIRECRNAGIDVKIITGDNRLTAKAVAESVGMEPGKIVMGEELENMSDEGLKLIVRQATIFARTDPKHKYRIVKALQELGEVVAVTGDGVNDAPALKRSDIGIAMGIKGTEVAKEASDIVLEDDNFATIVNAIGEGRRVYSNIRSFIKYMLSANFGEIAAITLLMLIGFPLPLLPLQILWINLITDSLPALALGREKAGAGIMAQGPRPKNEDMFRKFLLFIAIVAILQSMLAAGAFLYGSRLDMAAGIDISEVGVQSHARTMAFTMLVFFELALVFTCRQEGKTIFQMNPLGNKQLVGAVALSLALQLGILYLPVAQVVFRTAQLGVQEMGLLAFGAASGFLVPYLVKAVEMAVGKHRMGTCKVLD